MSTCPEKDIHSIYLDGELPESYAKKYEEHLETCENCRKYYESLKKQHSAFAADSKNIELTQAEMDKSWERLQARLSFSKHTKQSNVIEFKDWAKTAVPAVAGAAAALALVFIPMSNNVKKNGTISPTSYFTPVANVDLVSPSTAVFQADGEIYSSSVSKIFSSGETFVGNNDALKAFNSNMNTVSYNPNNARRHSNTARKFASYDVFTPVPQKSMTKESQNEFSVEFPMDSIGFNFQDELK